MEMEREEVYERIPWETLEAQRGDRQWVVYAVAGAVTLGALAYSFTRSQPGQHLPEAAPLPATTLKTLPPDGNGGEDSVSSPVVVAEADLFAVDPERLIDQVAAHAEWLAVEYVSFDGAPDSAETLTSMLPAGLPPPQAPEGTQVFVDWARAAQVTQTGPLAYEAEVLVRSLVSTGPDGFTRQPTRRLLVRIALGDDGQPRVSGVPQFVDAESPAPETIEVVSLPEDVLASLDASTDEVLGGVLGEDGSWEVVVMVTGSDGVSRATIVRP